MAKRKPVGAEERPVRDIRKPLGAESLKKAGKPEGYIWTLETPMMPSVCQGCKDLASHADEIERKQVESQEAHDDELRRRHENANPSLSSTDVSSVRGCEPG